jgi:putative ABC transport system permease protein
VVAVDENLPIYWVRTLKEAIAQNTWFYTVFGTLFVVFGGVALFLAAIGLYGVMSFAVSRRTKEVGVRMALGAERGDVLKLVLRQGLWQLAIGVVLGVGLGALLSRGLQEFLFEVGSLDPLTFVAIAIVLGGTGILASLVPARRATRVDPMVALRYE